MALDPFELLRRRKPVEVAPAPLAGTRTERLQRLQIGMGGIGVMLMLVGLADIVITRAALTEATVAPEAVPTLAGDENASPRDPLADAGVIPDLPDEPEAEIVTAPTPSQPMPPPANAPQAQ